MSELQRYKMIVEYRGTDYFGWQRQDSLPSIQQAIEDAIEKFSHQKLTIQAAGRTDAGVHARGQVFHADFEPLKKPLNDFQIAKAINAHLRPAPISILRAERVSDDFHARFSASNKLYRYRIITRPAPLTIEQGQAWLFYRPLNAAAMHEAAQVFIGQHDFTSFRDSECQAKSPIRTIDRVDVTARPYDECGGMEIQIEAEAQSFLHHQIRNFAGTLQLVGEGKWIKADVQNALNARDRKAAGPTAPAEGLYLMRIDY
jgi:tRNA pseudouridine38-40 synthase